MTEEEKNPIELLKDVKRLAIENARLRAWRDEYLSQPCVCQWQAEVDALKAAIEKILPGATVLKIENPTVGGFEYRIMPGNTVAIFASVQS